MTEIQGQFHIVEIISVQIKIRYVSCGLIEFNSHMSTIIYLFCYSFYVFYIWKTRCKKGVLSSFYDIRLKLYRLLSILSINSLSLISNAYTSTFSDIIDSKSDFSRIFIQFFQNNFAKPLSYQINSCSATSWNIWANTYSDKRLTVTPFGNTISILLITSKNSFFSPYCSLYTA